MSIIDIPQIELSPGLPPERFRLGEIYADKSLDANEIGIPEELAPREVRQVDVSDPYLWDIAVRNPEAIEDMRRVEAEADAMASRRLADGHWQRSPGTAYVNEEMNVVQKGRAEFGDPVTASWLFDSPEGLGTPVLKQWKRLIPSANALMYLSDPITPTFIEAKRGAVFEIDEKTRERWTTCIDAVAIRSRGTIMAEEVTNFFEQHPEKREHMHWMSVACGTALPAMKAANRAGIAPELTLLDIDPNAMNSTQKLAGEIDFKGSIKQRSMNIFDEQEMTGLKDELTAGDEDERPDIIDLMGIFEYTGDELGVDPVSFLRSNWELLKPGGRLVFGQMDKSRPVPNFTMGGIQWPYVAMRSPAEVMQIIKDAGLPLDATSLITQENGVYMVCTVDKPEEAGITAETTTEPEIVETAAVAAEQEVGDLTPRIVRGTVRGARFRRLAHRLGYFGDNN